ncbi:MAG TPA: PQQ-binding-like beta-propeller repeat protein [Bryobacteraceae bacterium]|nr:PQQ-binding-like beta-propeller repeat protein [Bryobacteraceae bacterium]
MVIASGAPASWPERLKLRWKISVGDGYASPIMAGDGIFVFSRQRGDEVASRIDSKSGHVLWQRSYRAPYKMNPAAERHGEGPKSTPVFYSSKVYTFGISGILTCWDAMTGAVRWRKDFSGQFRETSPLYGTAMSPLVDQGLLIAHVGGNDDGALIAFDAENGKVKWEWKGDGPAYASPIIVDLAGTRQVITQTQNLIAGFDAASGRLLWKIPFTTQYVQNIVTPVIYRDLLIFSGLAKGIMAVRVSVNGGKWLTETVWENPGLSMYMSSPVIDGDLLFGFSHLKRGEFFALDARTGATRWTSAPRQADNAALLVSGQNLILLKDDAEMIIAKAGGSAFEPIRSYHVADSPTWAHPLILKDGVVIKDQTTLAMWGVE